jgi:hypothetical protein
MKSAARPGSADVPSAREWDANELQLRSAKPTKERGFQATRE